VNYREVGNTGVRVSEIGFGCGGNAGLLVKGTPEQQREAILRALELGINYFDEAPDYGDGVSETISPGAKTGEDQLDGFVGELLDCELQFAGSSIHGCLDL